MKRTQRINFDAMRKVPNLRPSLLAISIALVLAGCDNTEPMKIYQSPEQCAAENPGKQAECNSAFERALSEAERTGPKYKTQQDCAAEFAANQCVQSSSGGWFMPAMAGFMVGQVMSRPGYVPTPVYTSYNSRSSMSHGWYGADGARYGSSSSRTASVSPDSLKPKPAVSRTLSRGGFGAKASAKSSWGGSRSGGRSSWGG